MFNILPMFPSLLGVTFIKREEYNQKIYSITYFPNCLQKKSNKSKYNLRKTSLCDRHMVTLYRWPGSKVSETRPGSSGSSLYSQPGPSEDLRNYTEKHHFLPPSLLQLLLFLFFSLSLPFSATNWKSTHLPFQKTFPGYLRPREGANTYPSPYQQAGDGCVYLMFPLFFSFMVQLFGGFLR